MRTRQLDLGIRPASFLRCLAVACTSVTQPPLYSFVLDQQPSPKVSCQLCGNYQEGRPDKWSAILAAAAAAAACIFSAPFSPPRSLENRVKIYGLRRRWRQRRRRRSALGEYPLYVDPGGGAGVGLLFTCAERQGTLPRRRARQCIGGTVSLLSMAYLCAAWR